MKKVKVVLLIENDGHTTVEANIESSIGALLKENVPQTSSRPDFEEDYEVYLVGNPDELSKDQRLETLPIKHGLLTLLVHRCKQISAKVDYMGKHFAGQFSPSTPCSKVLIEAANSFGIDPGEIQDFHLYTDENKTNMVKEEFPVGAYSKYKECRVLFYLSKPQANQGAIDEDLINDHLDSAVFLGGAGEGQWGVVKNEEWPKWPFFIFWIAAAPRQNAPECFFMRLELTNYNHLAPKGIFWSVDNNAVLEVGKRPRVTGIHERAFRTDWNNGVELYAPWDRSGLTAHPDWKDTYKETAWKAGVSSIDHYLRIVYKVFNSSSYHGTVDGK